MMITNNRDAAGIYIHIPFCMRKCRYCDFLSFEDHSSCDEYIEALIGEIEDRGGRYVDTVFIGGGTPSAIAPEHIVSIMEAVYDNFEIDEAAEITIEVNPGTLTSEKLAMYRGAGINRLSIGVQSFHDSILSGLGRIHSADTARKTVAMAKEAGFENISIDLMFAVPGLTMEIWKDTLSVAVSLGVKHISFYSLQIEEGTPFGEMFENGTLKETDESEDRKMYHYAIDFLKENGYLQYEVSNSAITGFESRHNMKYWEMADYLGMGLGASSFEGGRRTVNTSEMDSYLQWDRVDDEYINTPFDNASEFVFTGLRKTEGISLRDFEEFTGMEFFEVFPEAAVKTGQWKEYGFIEFDGDILKLTTAGMDIQNNILKEFV